MGAYFEGPVQADSLPFAASGNATLSDDTLQNVVTLQNNRYFVGTINRANVFLTQLSVSNNGNQDALIKIIHNATVASPTFNDIDSTRSRCSTDFVGAGVTEPSGNLAGGFVIAKNSSETLNLKDLDILVHPDETVTIAAQRGGNATLIIESFIRWEEQY